MVAQICGWLASLILVVCYTLISRGVWQATGWRYQTSVVVNSVLYGYMNYALGVWPMLPVNALFLGMAVYYIRRDIRNLKETP